MLPALGEDRCDAALRARVWQQLHSIKYNSGSFVILIQLFVTITSNKIQQLIFRNTHTTIHQQPKFILAQSTSHSQFNIHCNTIIYPPQTGHFRRLTFSSLFQRWTRTWSTFHSRFDNHQEFIQTLHRFFSFNKDLIKYHHK